MTTAIRVGLYVRISDDKDGTQTATERQEADCRRFAEKQGWDVVGFFADIDLSAFRPNVKRPEFERMLDAVRSRQVDGVLAWKLDRLTRRMKDWVRLDEACVEAKGYTRDMTTVIEDEAVLISEARDGYSPGTPSQVLRETGRQGA